MPIRPSPISNHGPSSDPVDASVSPDQLDQVGEQGLGLVGAADEVVGVDQPRRHEVEAALTTLQAVVVEVAVDRRSVP